MKKYGPSLVWNNCYICRQCILKEQKSFNPKQTEKNCDLNNIWDKYFLMIQQKKRDKCRQVWRWKKNGPSLVWNNCNICRQCILKEEKNFIPKWTETNCDQNNIWDKYFWWYSKKSATSVDKCDDEKNGPSSVWNNCNICRQCILKEEKKFIPKQTETNCDQNNIWDKYFLMIQQKKRDKCRQVWRWKNWPIPGLKQL